VVRRKCIITRFRFHFSFKSANEDDGGANIPLNDSMDDWIQIPNEERPKTFSSRHNESSKVVYNFIEDREADDYVQTSKDNNCCMNSTHENNCALELIEEEGNGSGEVGDIMIKKMQEDSSKHFKDVDLKIINV